MGRQHAASNIRTLIIELPGLNGGLTLRLSGGGLRETRAVAPQLPPAVLTYLREHPHPSRQRGDLMFTCGETLMALPHDVRVTVC